MSNNKFGTYSLKVLAALFLSLTSAVGGSSPETYSAGGGDEKYKPNFSRSSDSKTITIKFGDYLYKMTPDNINVVGSLVDRKENSSRSITFERLGDRYSYEKYTQVYRSVSMSLGYNNILKGGEFYYGKFDDSDTFFEGQGVFVNHEGTIFKGKFEGGNIRGNGTIHYRNGLRCEGNFGDGLKMSGPGVCRSKNGEELESDSWYSGEPGGKVKYTDKDGNRLEYEDFPTSSEIYAKFTFKNGDVYEGPYRDGKGNGQWKLSFADKSVLETEMRDGAMCGKGKLTSPDGKVTEGEFRVDESESFRKKSENQGSKDQWYYEYWKQQQNSSSQDEDWKQQQNSSSQDEDWKQQQNSSSQDED
ncbi:MAG: hypothetical protein LBU15_04370, partial [Rickettsiales bacterium]|nr:hypothetical protein [Rickettsiales bacterium]